VLELRDLRRGAAVTFMGNSLCGPIIRARLVPVCCLCEISATKPWMTLSRKEKQHWFIHDGEFFCARCLVSHRILQLQESKPGEYKRALTADISERYAKGPRDWTPLKKVSSGKVWQNTSSFKAPYAPSPALKAKVARVKRNHRQPKCVTATEDLSASIAEPLSNPLHLRCEKHIQYSTSAPSKLDDEQDETDGDELRTALLSTVEERNHISWTPVTEPGDSKSEEGPGYR